MPLAYLVLAPIVLVTAVAYSVYHSTPLGTRPGGENLHISRTKKSLYLGFVARWLKWLPYIAGDSFHFARSISEILLSED